MPAIAAVNIPVKNLLIVSPRRDPTFASLTPSGMAASPQVKALRIVDASD
jgi:hypothetical protein